MLDMCTDRLGVRKHLIGRRMRRVGGSKEKKERERVSVERSGVLGLGNP